MVMNVYRQMDRSDLQFDFLLKEKSMMATSKKSRRWEGTFFMLKAPKK